MRVARPREVNLKIDDFPDRTLLRRFEGGSVYLASRDRRFHVLINRSAAVDVLSAEDREGISPAKVLEFDSEADRTEYLRRRRWLPDQGLIDPD